ncbi:hypothetical protein ACWD46_32170, partial [Streptomyces sp. NPDC002486]
APRARRSDRAPAAVLPDPGPGASRFRDARRACSLAVRDVSLGVALPAVGHGRTLLERWCDRTGHRDAMA